MSWVERMRDAANPAGGLEQSGWAGAVAGYLGGGDPANVWTAATWAKFPGHKKLPIFVQTNPAHAVDDAMGVLRSLHFLGVPAGRGIFTALDLELAVAPAYVTSYGEVLHWAGFRVWPYGSVSALFGNPPLDGYWAADYAGVGPFMYNHPEVVATQYASPSTGSGGDWDSSTLRIEVQAGAWWV